MADRQGLFKAYCNFSAEDFYDQMTLMCGFCAAGSEDIPKDAEKADYWRTVMEKHLEESGKSEQQGIYIFNECLGFMSGIVSYKAFYLCILQLLYP